MRDPRFDLGALASLSARNLLRNLLALVLGRDLVALATCFATCSLWRDRTRGSRRSGDRDENERSQPASQLARSGDTEMRHARRRSEAKPER
jgi:hypothetical protein